MGGPAAAPTPARNQKRRLRLPWDIFDTLRTPGLLPQQHFHSPGYVTVAGIQAMHQETPIGAQLQAHFAMRRRPLGGPLYTGFAIGDQRALQCNVRSSIRVSPRPGRRAMYRPSMRSPAFRISRVTDSGSPVQQPADAADLATVGLQQAFHFVHAPGRRAAGLRDDVRFISSDYSWRNSEDKSLHRLGVHLQRDAVLAGRGFVSILYELVRSDRLHVHRNPVD